MRNARYEQVSRKIKESWARPHVAKRRADGIRAAWRDPGRRARRFIRTALSEARARRTTCPPEHAPLWDVVVDLLSRAATVADFAEGEAEAPDVLLGTVVR